AAPHHSASLNGLEVVLRHVIGDFPAQGLRLYVGSAEMQAGPDAGVDDLLEGIREPVEVAGFTRKTAARHAESDLVRAEEHLQHLEVRTVAREVARRVFRVDRKSTRLNSSHDQISYA